MQGLDEICLYKIETEKSIEDFLRRAKNIDLSKMPDDKCYECTGYNIECIFYVRSYNVKPI